MKDLYIEPDYIIPMKYAGVWLAIILVGSMVSLYTPVSVVGPARADTTDEVLLPQWKTGNQWVYSLDAMVSMSGTLLHAVGSITYKVEGTETITISSQNIECYKVSYNRPFTAEGNTRAYVHVDGTTTGTEWYSVDTLELLKADYSTSANGYATEGGNSVNLAITDHTVITTTTIGNFWDFPLESTESWSSASVKSMSSDSFTDYTPDGGFYPDDQHTVSSVTLTESISVQSTGRETKGTQGFTGETTKVVGSDQWSLSGDSSDSGTGSITCWISHLVGNSVEVDLSNVYYMGLKVSSGTLSLTSKSYTYTPPPEYGVNANADDNTKEVKPGGSVNFTITVQNSGGIDDTINGEVLDGGTNWGTLTPTNLSLTAGSTGQVVYSVTVPKGAIPDDYTDQLKFTSQGDATKFVVVTLTIRVLANMPPKITSRTPAQNTVEMLVNETMEFRIHAIDPEGSALSYHWTVNDTDAGDSDSISVTVNTTLNFTVRRLDVKVVISDGEKESNASWTLKVLPEGSNRAPNVVWVSPKEPIIHGYDIESVKFGISIQDPDGDDVGLDYYMDSKDSGIFRSVPRSPSINDSFTIQLKDLSVGRHSLLAVYYDYYNDQPKHIGQVTWDLIIESSSSVVFPAYNLTPEDGALFEKGAKIDIGFETNYTHDYRVDWFLDWAPISSLYDTHISVDTSKLKVGSHIASASIYPEIGNFRMLMWNFTVVEDLYPPIEPDPSRHSVSTNLKETVTLKIQNDDPQWSYTWMIDGQVDNSHRSYYMKTSFNQPGPHNITVNVTNSYHRSTIWVWNITVSNKLNKPPVITAYYPPRDVRIKEGEDVNFRVNTADNDDINDKISVTWYKNNIAVSEGNEYVLTSSIGDEGKYTVKAVVSDGKYSVEHQWTVQISAAPQKLTEETTDHTLEYFAWGAGITVFILLIALVNYAFQPPHKRKKKSKHVHCPKCMAYIEENWAFCPTCGTRLDLRCSGCGNMILQDWNVCPNCNKRLSARERGLSNMPRSAPSNTQRNKKAGPPMPPPIKKSPKKTKRTNMATKKPYHKVAESNRDELEEIEW